MSSATDPCPVIPTELAETHRRVRDALNRVAKDDPELAEIIEARLGSEQNWNDETVGRIMCLWDMFTKLVG